MAEYSKIARGSFTTAASPVAQVVNLPFQPQRVKLLNYTAYSAPAQYAVTEANWDIAMGQGVASLEYLEAASAPWIPAVDYVASSGISTFSAGLALQFGAQEQISGITKASPAVVTTASPHGYSSGDVVMFQGLAQSASTGMQQIAGMPFTITVTGASTFTIPWNTNQSNYTALSGSPTGAFVKKVLYPFLYLPGVNFVSAITTGTTTTVTTTTNHNFVVGQEIAFRIPSVYGTSQLNSLPNVLIPGSPIYGYVTSVTSNTIFVCSINSTSFTAFNSNQTFASVPGLLFPQVLAVGDVNSGGQAISAGSPLYPSPQFPTFSGGASTINGPAINGAYVNCTSQGFIVGLGVGAVQSSALLLTASSLYIYEAYLYDISK
jgi:hypothetical protein